MTLQPATVREMMAQSTTRLMLMFATLFHPDFDELSQPVNWPIRLVGGSRTDLTGPSGHTFQAAAFEAQLPDDDNEGVPQMRVKLIGPAELVMNRLREIIHAPTLRVELASYDRSTELVGPVERTIDGLKLRDVELQNVSFQFTFRQDELSSEPFPAIRYSAVNFPGLF